MTEDVKKRIQSQFASSGDLKSESIRIQDIELELLYLDSVCYGLKIKDDLIRPILECSGKQEFTSYLTSLPDVSKPDKNQDVLPKFISGHVCIFMDNDLFLFNAEKEVNNELGESSSEMTIYGSQHSYSDNIITNLNITRNLYPSANLTYEQKKIGRSTQTEVAILYDSQLVDKQILKDIQNRLASIQSDVILSTAQLQRLLTSRKFTLFPVMMVTERPDRVALNLSQGKIVLFVQGNAFALLAPAVFYDFICTMDDVFEQFWISFTLSVLRYIAVFITMLLPAIYISIVSFNPELFQLQLTLSIAGSRVGVPYSSLIEVLIMMFFIEALIEASIRLPKSFSAAATTVGGLILGQAAQQANLVSSSLIIVTSAIGLSSFVVPINSMSFALRIIKYPFILLASFFGMVGITIGLFCLIIYLSDLKSFGRPYLKLFVGEEEKFGKL